MRSSNPLILSSPTCFGVLEFLPSNLKAVWNFIRRQSRFEKDTNESVTSSSSPDLVDMDTSINIDLLPVELIEVMLSKCPVKSVVRFKSVCKQWHAIISDPRFSRIHRIQRRSKPSENMYLMWENILWIKKPSRIYMMRLEDGKPRVESVFEYPPRSLFGPLSCFDGIFLLNVCYSDHDYMLWNPSIQKGTMIHGALMPDNGHYPRTHHFYHDATSDDYKIVFVSYSCYTVYSCRSGSWGEMKDLPCGLVEASVSVDGCFYELRDGGEVVCFDARDGKVDRFRQPKDIISEGGGGGGGKVKVELAEVSGRLCLHSLTEDGTKIQLWVMEKRGRSFENVCWRRLMSMEKEEGDLCFSHPVCLIDQDKVVLLLHRVGKLILDFDEHVIYNTRQKTFQKIELNICCATQLFPFQENLYLPSSNILV